MCLSENGRSWQIFPPGGGSEESRVSRPQGSEPLSLAAESLQSAENNSGSHMIAEWTLQGQARVTSKDLLRCLSPGGLMCTDSAAHKQTVWHPGTRQILGRFVTKRK